VSSLLSRTGRFGAAVLGAVLVASAFSGAAHAQGLFGLFGGGERNGGAPASGAGNQIATYAQAIDQALNEKRLVDAGLLLDRAYASGLDDPQLSLRSGELHLERGRYAEALSSFTDARRDPSIAARALQGEGLAQSQLGRSEEAVAALETAVAADPTLWRAWNALAVERDRLRDWTGAEQAYAQALTSPNASAIVLNNRGYSRLLQGRYEEASNDLVEALAQDPALAVARTNLRLSLAMRGDYSRATRVSGAEDRAAVLNNAGFAALMRGELDEAEQLFQRAIEARGNTYGRAYENLEMVRALKGSEASATQ
jgi:Flp pilus assembly protein TadD